MPDANARASHVEHNNSTLTTSSPPTSSSFLLLLGSIFITITDYLLIQLHLLTRLTTSYCISGR